MLGTFAGPLLQFGGGGPVEPGAGGLAGPEDTGVGLEALKVPGGPLGPWLGPCKPACGGPVFLLEGARRRSFRGGN